MTDDWDLYADQVCLEFGELLRAERERAELRQVDLADRLGLQRTSIANMESGKQTPSLPQVLAIAQILGVEPNVLLPRVQAPVEPHAEFKVKVQPYLRIADQVMKAAVGGGR